MPVPVREPFRPDTSMLSQISPANRYRLSVILTGFLVIQTFLPLLPARPEWQSAGR